MWDSYNVMQKYCQDSFCSGNIVVFEELFLW